MRFSSGTGDDLAPGHELLARELWSDALASGEVCRPAGMIVGAPIDHPSNPPMPQEAR